MEVLVNYSDIKIWQWNIFPTRQQCITATPVTNQLKHVIPSQAYQELLKLRDTII